MERNRAFQMLFLVGVAMLTLLQAANAQYGGGTGEPNDPYLIWTAEQMNAIGADPNDWDKHFKLMADIDLSAYDGQDGRAVFNIIGYRRSWEDKNPFSGVLDGSGYAVRNLTRRAVEQASVGLFGYVNGPEAEIYNIGLIDPNAEASARYATGALVGYLEKGTLTNCCVVDGTVFSKDVAGALVGINCCGSIQDCYSTGTTVAGSAAGGLIGSNSRFVTRCYSSANVASSDDAGGLIAHNGGKITDCYASGTVNGSDMVGGLTGRHGGGRSGTAGTILNCYSTSTVSGGSYTGGLVGYGKATVIGSYWDIESSGQTESAGGVGKTTLQMQTAETFLAWGACDHNDAWTIDEGQDYPRLSWQNRPGQPLGPLPLADLLAGTGTAQNPFLIHTADELNLIGLFPCEWNRCFRLVADVNMAACSKGTVRSIGVYDIPFTGVFDGNDRTIANLAFGATNGPDTALFLSVSDPNAQIKDLQLIHGHSETNGGGRTAMLVAYLRDGNVTNCHGINNTVSGGTSVGGLIAQSVSGIVTDCTSTGVVTGTWHVGGLVGHNYGSVADCWASAVVSGTSWIGGLAGSNDGIITRCFSESIVAGKSAGGLAGNNGHGPPWGVITNSYATGEVSGSSRVAGFVGDNASGTIANCYSASAGGSAGGGFVAYDRHDGAYITGSFWDIEASGRTVSAGGTGLTTAEAQTASTFLKAGWDFVGGSDNGTEDIWWVLEGQDYPRLSWELLGDDAVVFVVDDFEDYNDLPGYEIFTAWVDPYDVLPNGGIVGHDNAPYAEQTIIHSGLQSMPFYYANTHGRVNSRAYHPLHAAQDWTTSGAAALLLWFRGAADNDPDAFYITVNNATVFHPDPNAVRVETWTPWIIPLNHLVNAGLNVQRVTTLQIGVGDKTKPSQNARGLLYIDDIGLVKRP